MKKQPVSKSVARRTSVQSKKGVASPPVAAVSSPVNSVNSAPSTSDQEHKTAMITLTLDTKARKGNSGVFYTSPDLKGAVRILRAAFNGEPPATLRGLEGGDFVPPGVAKAKMTKEERAAARAALTPQDKARIAQERANKAVARANALAAAAGV